MANSELMSGANSEIAFSEILHRLWVCLNKSNKTLPWLRFGLHKLNETLTGFGFFSTNKTKFKPCAAFGFFRITQTRLRAFFTLALVLFKKNSKHLKTSARWNFREQHLNTIEKKKLSNYYHFCA